MHVEARNVEEKPYSRNTMRAIRSGLDRFLSGSQRRKSFSVIRDKEFKSANEAHDAVVKDFARHSNSTFHGCNFFFGSSKDNLAAGTVS